MATVERAQAVQSTFEAVVLPHIGRGARLARLLLRNEQDAEDAVQDALLRALRYFRTFDGRDGRAWFLCIVRNTCESSRGRRARTITDPFDEERHTDVTRPNTPEAELLRHDRLDAVTRALGAMPPRFRELFVRREVDGLSYRELAASIGAPIGTVMSGLSRARRAVRGALADDVQVSGVGPSAMSAARPAPFNAGRIRRQSTRRKRSGIAIMRKTATVLFTLALAASVGAQGLGRLAKFDGGIGVIPVQNGAGAANEDGTLPNVKLNIVRGINPGAGPWRIADLRAEISTDGHIKVEGKGLLLASGNSIGQNANQNVFATLVCEATAPFVNHNSSFSVPLDANGNFRMDDVLSSVPVECPSPALLIRSSVPGGPWLAAGIQKLGGN
jgi:RNA polymerase sigma factor (sigma-70 family)